MSNRAAQANRSKGAQKLRESAACDAVKTEQALRGQFYKLATDTLSLVEGLVSKDHALTQKLRGLRADLIGHQNPGGSATAPAAAFAE